MMMMRHRPLPLAVLVALVATVRLAAADDPYPPGEGPPAVPAPATIEAATAPLPAQAPDGGAGPAASDAAAQREGEMRLRLLAAQLALLTGRFGEARAGYAALVTEMPASAAPQEGLGAVARETGRQRLALEHYRAALLLEPENTSVASSLAALERERAPRLRGDVEQRFQRGGIGSDRADITVSEVGGYLPVGEAWRIGVTQGLAFVDATNVRRAAGTIQDITASRIRTEIYATHEWPQGQSVTVSLFANEWSAGFGVLGRLPDDTGSTAFRAEYQRPIWDFVEAIVDGAVRDRVSIERFQRFTPDLTLRLEAGLNRYGIPRDDEDLLQSVTLRGELRLAGLAGVDGLSISYALDAEYVTSETIRFDAAGNAYLPLPIEDREVHALLLGHGGGIGAATEDGRFTWQASAGYGADRYGRSGPVAFGSIGYALGSFEAALRAGYVRNIGRSRGETTILGATLAWVF